MAQEQSTDAPSDTIAVPQEPWYRQRETRRAAIFFLLLFGLNTFRVIVLLPWEGHLNDLVATVTEVSIKGAIWIGLPFLLIVYGEKQPFLTTVKLRGNVVKGILTGLLGSLVLAGYFAFQVVITHASIHLAARSLFSTVPLLLAGLIEEIPFRGYLLSTFERRIPLFEASVLTAALFAIMHLPLWLSTGTNLIVSGIYVLWIASLLGFAVGWSRSLWSGIIMHAFSNAAPLLLGGSAL